MAVSNISQAVIFSILFFLSININRACSDSPSPPDQKQTHLHFYFTEYTSGSNATKLQVVQAPNSTEFTFGAISVVDDILRDGQDENSTLIGRAQGIIVASGMDGSLSTFLNLVFTDGAYNGSTIAIYGRFSGAPSVERPVVGGTGVFRMARGYSIATPVVVSSTEYLYEFNVYVWHY